MREEATSVHSCSEPYPDKLNLCCGGVTCLHTAWSPAQCTQEDMEYPGSGARPCCSALCQGAIKISQLFCPELGMLPAWAPVKFRPSQNHSTKFASCGSFIILVVSLFSMPKKKYFSLFCLLRLELKTTEQQAVYKRNDKQGHLHTRDRVTRLNFSTAKIIRKNYRNNSGFWLLKNQKKPPSHSIECGHTRNYRWRNSYILIIKCYQDVLFVKQLDRFPLALRKSQGSCQEPVFTDWKYRGRKWKFKMEGEETFPLLHIIYIFHIHTYI